MLASAGAAALTDNAAGGDGVDLGLVLGVSLGGVLAPCLLASVVAAVYCSWWKGTANVRSLRVEGGAAANASAGDVEIKEIEVRVDERAGDGVAAADVGI